MQKPLQRLFILYLRILYLFDNPKFEIPRHEPVTGGNAIKRKSYFCTKV